MPDGSPVVMDGGNGVGVGFGVGVGVGSSVGVGVGLRVGEGVGKGVAVEACVSVSVGVGTSVELLQAANRITAARISVIARFIYIPLNPIKKSFSIISYQIYVTIQRLIKQQNSKLLFPALFEILS